MTSLIVPLIRYVEFEYGDEQAEEREWRIPDHGSSITGTQLRTGTDINILETRRSCMQVLTTAPSPHRYGHQHPRDALL